MNDMAFSIIMLVCCYIVLPIMTAMLANESKPKKNIIVGNTLPYNARYDEQVLSLCKAYRKELWLWCIVLTVLIVPAFFIPYFSIQLTFWMCWLIGVMGIQFSTYVRTYRKLRQMKRENGWYSETAEKKTVIDLNAVNLPSKSLSAWWFLPPILLCIAVGIFATVTANSFEERIAMISVFGFFALFSALSWLIYHIIFRQKADVVDDNTDVNAALTRVRRYNWGKCWIYLNWTTALLCLAMWVWNTNAIAMLIVTCLYTVTLIWLCLRTEFTARKAQERISAQSGQKQYVDEDEYWILGMLYYNKNDRHLSVNSRVGINMTFNIAKPIGMIVTVLSLLCIVAMPFIGVWTIVEEFTPIELRVSNTTVEVQHVTSFAMISLEEITSVTFLEELPNTTRVSGTGFPALYKGKFNVEGYGICRICLDPRAERFIVIKTEKQTYIFSRPVSQDTSETLKLLGKHLNIIQRGG